MKHLLFALAAAAIGTAGPFALRVDGQTNIADPVRTPLMQNDSISVTHLRFGPGTREVTHTHPFPLVLVQITPGDISVQEHNQIKRSSRAGEVWYIPTNRPHALTSVAESTKAIELLAVALLPTRAPAPNAPATEAPPGITRTTLVDNNDARIVRVRFSPGAAEPLHDHPNDLLTIQISTGKLDVQMGTEHRAQEREPGFVQFLPRNVQHAYKSQDTKPFEIISLTIK